VFNFPNEGPRKRNKQTWRQLRLQSRTNALVRTFARSCSLALRSVYREVRYFSHWSEGWDSSPPCRFLIEISASVTSRSFRSRDSPLFSQRERATSVFPAWDGLDDTKQDLSDHTGLHVRRMQSERRAGGRASAFIWTRLERKQNACYKRPGMDTQRHLNPGSSLIRRDT
jgi:hypothetical protein